MHHIKRSMLTLLTVGALALAGCATSGVKVDPNVVSSFKPGVTTLADAEARLGPPLFAAAGLFAGALWPWTREVLELVVAGTGEAAESLKLLLLAAVAIHAGSLLLTAVVMVVGSFFLIWLSATQSGRR